MRLGSFSTRVIARNTVARARWIVQLAVEASPGSHPLDRQDPHVAEPGTVDFLAQLIRHVEVGEGEPFGMTFDIRVPVDSVGQVTFDDSLKPGVKHRPGVKPVKGRGESRDCSGEEDTTWAHDAMGLSEGLSAMFLLDEMVERTQQQDGIGGLVVEREGACVADFG